jgi:hypothetical protein
MNFIVSHNFIEGNTCADGLANIGLNIDTYMIWYELSQDIREIYVLNWHGKPNSRFVNM